MDSLTSLLAGARRRSIANLMLEQVCAGLCAALAGFLLLLLVGSEALDWRWLLVLFGGGAAWSAWRTFRGLPGLYGVAQQIDNRLGLSDTLSTAFAFRDRPARTDETVWRSQQEEAERLSAGIPPNQASPWKKPRYWSALAGLVLAAGIGFFARYGILGTMDLRAPAIQSLNDWLQPEAKRATQNAKNARRGGDTSSEPGAEEQEAEGEEQLDANGQAPDDESDSGDDTSQSADATKREDGASKAGDEQSENSEAGDGDQQAEQRAGNKDQDSAPNQADTEQADSNNQQAGNQNPSNESPGLFDKMRDAMANLMNKLQPKSQNAQKGPSQGDPKRADQQNQQPGEGEQGRQSAGGSPESDRQQAQSEMSQNQGAGKEGSSRSDSDAPKSGFGNQDGSKEIKMAQEQQEAMGKLSEILGERSKTVKGEVLIELKSSKQQELRTAFQESNAAHQAAGGEIRRDEIPLEMQRYVENYFEEIRRADRRAAPAAGVEN